MSVNTQSLDEFQGWEELSSQEDFFSKMEDDIVTDEPNPLDQEDPEIDSLGEESKDEITDEPVVPVNNEPDLFGADDAEDDDEGEEEEQEEGSTFVSDNISTVSFLREKGILDFELEEGEELTEDLAKNYLDNLEDNYDEAIDKRLEGLFKDLPEEIKQMNKYVLGGGDMNEFMQALTKVNAPGITEDLDIEDEANQEAVMKTMLSQEGHDEEYIKAQIEFLKDSGRLASISGTQFEKWKTGRKEYLADQTLAQKEKVKEERARLKKERSEMESYLQEKEKIHGLTVSKRDKESLPAYLMDKTVKLENGQSITQMQKELFYEVMQDKDASLQLAMLLKNRNKDGSFNFDSVKNSVKTDLTKNVKNNLRRAKSNVPQGSESQTTKNTNKSLADFFN